MSLSAKDILARKCRVKEFKIDAMDDASIHVREFTMSDLEKFQNAKPLEASVTAIILGVCDSKGERIFTNDDFDQLSELPQQEIMGMSMAVMVFNGMISEKEAAKNS